jgi:hypothetical protein
MPNSDVPTRTARRQEAGPKKRARPTSRNRPPSHDTVCRTGPFILIRAAPVHPDPGPACRLAEATADRAGRAAGRVAAVDAQLASTQVAPDQQVVARHTPLQSAAAAAPAAHDASGLKWMRTYKDAVATADRSHRPHQVKSVPGVQDAADSAYGDLSRLGRSRFAAAASTLPRRRHDSADQTGSPWCTVRAGRGLATADWLQFLHPAAPYRSSIPPPTLLLTGRWGETFAGTVVYICPR